MRRFADPWWATDRAEYEQAIGLAGTVDEQVGAFMAWRESQIYEAVATCLDGWHDVSVAEFKGGQPHVGFRAFGRDWTVREWDRNDPYRGRKWCRKCRKSTLMAPRVVRRKVGGGG